MDLSQLRKKIDELDQKIIGLLNERTEFAREVGKKKTEAGKEIYAPERKARSTGRSTPWREREFCRRML